MIELRDVDYRYPDAPDLVLHDVSMQVERGDRVGIVGPNGSGKSTLGRLMKALLLPTRGSIVVDNLDTRSSGLDVRERVGLVFQNPNSQIVNSVVEQEVAFGPENLGLPPQEIRQRVDAALRDAGLEHRATAECHSLSMADKQRVALAAVMVMQPHYLVLDEPTAWLEPAARWPILQTVLRWCGQHDVGLVLITHRMDEMQICRSVYGMLHGRIESTGTPKEILENQEVRARLALDVPDTFLLARELQAEGLPVEQGASVDFLAEALCQTES
jgi:energy-coupling factor transport system ATP-binding protein